MLKGIPAVISPELMFRLMNMGHGEEILLADADFPAGKHPHVLRADGIGVETLLEAVLPFFPLDGFVERPAIVMDCSPWGDEPESYGRYRKSLKKHHPKFSDLEQLERFEFYRRAEACCCIVITGEPDGNLILKKGPVM